MTADQIIAALRQKHGRDSWARFEELSVHTAPRPRRMDFYAVSCTPGQKIYAVSYEVKTSRSDFLAELKQPDKRGWAEELSNECYFAAPKGVCSIDELPERWGLITCSEKLHLTTRKPAPHHDLESLPMWFVASIARRMTDAHSPIDKRAWKYAGEDLDESELLSILKDVLGDELRWRAGGADRKAVDAFKANGEYQRLREIAAAVRTLAPPGGGMSQVDALTEWAAGRAPTMTNRQRIQLKHIRDNLVNLFDDVEAKRR